MIKKELKDYIVDQLENTKVEDIIIVDTSKISSMADWVIIGSGTSGKQIESTITILKNSLKKDGLYNGGMISGVANDGWIIFDLGNIIVHLFVPAVRDIYKLEELFSPKLKNNISNEKTITKISEKKSLKTDSKDKKIIKKPALKKQLSKSNIKVSTKKKTTLSSKSKKTSIKK